jgi:CubicO group peptidase (beta-lactamase class C family)
MLHATRLVLASLLLSTPLLGGCAPPFEPSTDPESTSWPTATPAESGLNAAVLDSIDEEIRLGMHGLVDRLLVIRQGRKVFDTTYEQDYEAVYGDSARVGTSDVVHHRTGPYNYFNDWWHPYYRQTDLHTLQSVTKTITSVVIGVAVTRGDFPSIDTPVLSFFDTTRVQNIDRFKRQLTVRHLLTMTTGMDYDEDEDVAALEGSYDWVKHAIDTPMREAPGTRFNYDSGGSQLLSQIFFVATGHDIEEYAARHLFAPLGITSWYWKRTPAGRIDTLGGLYLAADDLARIWQLFLQDGTWNGQRVVAREWIEASVTPAVAVDPGRSGEHYGFKWWLPSHPHDPERYLWAGNGYGGQYPMAAPDEELVVIIYQWNILGQPRLDDVATMERLLRAISDG